MMSDQLSKLREQIRSVDDQIFQLLSHRIKLARKIGRTKLEHNLPIKDYEVEKRVLETAREKAKDYDIYQDFAEDITKTLIQYACRVQDEFFGQRRRPSDATQKRIAIVGGLGQMGRWLADFFETFGHEVWLCDPAPYTEEIRFRVYPDAATVAAKADVVVLATPISVTETLLEQACHWNTQALILDICSLKSPLVPKIRAAVEKGLRVASIHPMFGPDTQYLVGENILICEQSESPELADQAFQLFEATSAKFIRVPLHKHDELIGYILGLSHLTNLVFAQTLTRSGFPFSQLREIGSTTFNAQLAVSEKVSQENQSLYFEIQSLNAATDQILSTFQKTVADFQTAIVQQDQDGFCRMMQQSRDYFSEH